MRVVIVGSGTGVGKTHVAQALAHELRRTGVRCAALKPVESGGREDAVALGRASAFHVKPSPLYPLARPVSPHLAARLQGDEISIPRIVEWVNRVSQGVEVTLVETAGGLLSPLSARTTNADLVAELVPAEVLVVAPDRLGVLHDVTALHLAWRALKLPPPTTVLSCPPEPDPSTGTNAAELEFLGIVRVAAVFPPGQPDDQPSATAASEVLRLLRGGSPAQV